METEGEPGRRENFRHRIRRGKGQVEGEKGEEMRAFAWTLAMTLLPTVALCDGRVPRTIIDTVDIVEENIYPNPSEHTVKNGNADFCLIQLILWKFNWEKSRYEVVTWRQWDQNEKIHFDSTRGMYRLDLYEKGYRRIIYAKSYRRRFTRYDAELRNQKVVPKAMRRGLTPKFEWTRNRERIPRS